MRTELRVAGFGGQGVILTGVVIARAAGIHDDREVAQTQSYGPEARGGACKCDVVVSDSRILYPKVDHPQYLLCMSQPAMDKYGKDLDADTVVVADSTLVHSVPQGRQVAWVPATAIAEEELGKRMAANMVMLGALSRVSAVVSVEALRQAVCDSVPPKFRDLNLQALEAGYERVRVAS